MRANALVVELLVARLRVVQGLTTFCQHDTPPVPLTVEERAAPVIMGSHVALQPTWQGLELADHFLILDLLRVILRVQQWNAQEGVLLRHVRRQRTE